MTTIYTDTYPSLSLPIITFTTHRQSQGRKQVKRLMLSALFLIFALVVDLELPIVGSWQIIVLIWMNEWWNMTLDPLKLEYSSTASCWIESYYLFKDPYPALRSMNFEQARHFYVNVKYRMNVCAVKWEREQTNDVQVVITSHHWGLMQPVAATANLMLNAPLHTRSSFRCLSCTNRQISSNSNSNRSTNWWSLSDLIGR